jgi:glycosyltransferase involved in cell wall biosynthesis
VTEQRRLILLFTTFPVATETFLQREVRALRELGVDLEMWSCWGGEADFDGMPVHRLSQWGWSSLVFWIPYWFLRGPRRFFRLFQPWWRRPPPNWTNFLENLAGLGIGARLARRFETSADDPFIHAVWATMPTTVAWTTRILTDRPYSFAAHAYDLFEHGGDWILPVKIAAAQGVRTSTEVGAQRLREAGAREMRLAMIRRGFETLPAYRSPRPAGARGPESVCRILSVGRLVEKMGYLTQLQVYRRLGERGFAFTAEIIGEGPDRARIEAEIARLGLASRIRLHGHRTIEEVWEALEVADVALFTGGVAQSGDRAGFPNFLGEAMAVGVPVVTTPVGAVQEVIRHAQEGLVVATEDALSLAILETWSDPAAAAERTMRARAWIETHFDAAKNMRELLRRLAEWQVGKP